MYLEEKIVHTSKVSAPANYIATRSEVNIAKL